MIDWPLIKETINHSLASHLPTYLVFPNTIFPITPPPPCGMKDVSVYRGSITVCRHGRKHEFMPTSLNYRANIEALRLVGCTHIIATTACGSLREEIHPGDLVIVDQFIDRTYKRETTFYDGKPGSKKGICHIQMDKPFCERTRSILIRAAKELEVRCHDRGTVVTIEGPRFSSKAESMMFRSWNCDLVNMTIAPEVCLAKEAGICYASIALPTDYDSWKDDAVKGCCVVNGRLLYLL